MRLELNRMGGRSKRPILAIIIYNILFEYFVTVLFFEYKFLTVFLRNDK